MKHLTDLDFRRFYSHTLRCDEEMSLLEHAAKCDYCAGRLSSAFPERELLSPPPDLCSDILDAAKKIPSRKEMKLEFYRYSTKVVLAMGMALSLLVLGNFSDNIFSSIPIKIEFRSEKNTSVSDISPEKKAYQETVQKQKAENKETQEKFLQEKKELQANLEQKEQKKDNEKSSDSISKNLKKFSSNLLSYFKK